MTPVLKIGTRASRLALVQAESVQRSLNALWYATEIEKIQTAGDRILDVPLAQVGGKGLFIKEIEEALLCDRVHLAVHSAKDVPAFLPNGLHLAAVTKREDARDAIISRDHTRWDALPIGAVIGTSSLRRQAQLSAHRPDLRFVPLRGNLDTRLKKLSEGQCDAIVLAAAGLHRLNWRDRISDYLPVEISLPAVGQGALCIECKRDAMEANAAAACLNDAETACCIQAERAMLSLLEGGCQVPIAGFATVSDGHILLRGLVASTDGKRVIYAEQSGPASEAKQLGQTLANTLLERGAGGILTSI